MTEKPTKEGSEIARQLGSIRTEKKSRASRENARKALEALQDPAKREAASQKQSQARKEYWARVRAGKEAAAAALEAARALQTDIYQILEDRPKPDGE